MALVDALYDPEMERIKMQLAQAAAMRQPRAGSRGEMVGPVRTVGNQLGDIVGSIAAPFLEKRAMDEQGRIVGERQQAEQDWLGQMPQETRDITLPADQAGPVGTINKTPGQLAGEMRNWSAQGMKLPNSPLARSIAQYGVQRGIEAPQRMLESETRSEDRRAEQEFRAAQAKELAAQRAAEKAESDRQRAADREANIRLAASLRPGPQPREPRMQLIQTTDENGNPIQKIVAMEPGTTFPALPKAPNATVLKGALAQKDKQNTLNEALINLDTITKKGGPLEKATASGMGTLVDEAAGFFGYGTEGAINAAKLAPLADPILKMVPRFEGPQSDKDTATYKEAAGQLANSNLPTSVRLSAAETIKAIMTRRKGQFSVAGQEEAPPAVSGADDPLGIR